MTSHRPPTAAVTRVGRRLIWAALAVLALLLVPAAPAAADVAFEDSTPADGASLEAWPEQIRLSFSGELQSEFVTVAVTRDGAKVDGTSIEVAGRSIEVSVPASAISEREGAGAWQVSYRVVAEDGHPLTGAVGFDVAEPTPSASPTETAGASAQAPTTPDTSASPSARSDVAGDTGDDTDSSSNTSTVVIGALVAALTLGATFWLWRARRSASADS